MHKQGSELSVPYGDDTSTLNITARVREHNSQLRDSPDAIRVIHRVLHIRMRNSQFIRTYECCAEEELNRIQRGKVNRKTLHRTGDSRQDISRWDTRGSGLEAAFAGETFEGRGHSLRHGVAMSGLPRGRKWTLVW